ncbi:LysR family transcriptional regulator [Thauera sp.]|uniref:LysR family transcriptional regulator n=1 Tax=Thauera sp. TaxID=1905334 RepID=UPI0039E5FCD9
MSYPDLQVDWLKCFVAVVDAGSLSSAAPELHRSQSAVSMQLKKLEAAVGRQLLVRGPRQHQLTPDGQVLLGYARRILDLHAEAQTAFHGEELAGRVRLGVPDDYAATYLTPVLKRFAPRHGNVEIELDCEQSTSLIPRVERGELDLALISRDHARRGTLLFHEPMVWVGSPQFDAWRRDPLPIAVYESSSLARRSAINSLGLQGRRYRVVLQQLEPGGADRRSREWPGRRRSDSLQCAGSSGNPGQRPWSGAAGADGSVGVPEHGFTRFEGRGWPV